MPYSQNQKNFIYIIWLLNNELQNLAITFNDDKINNTTVYEHIDQITEHMDKVKNVLDNMQYNLDYIKTTLN